MQMAYFLASVLHCYCTKAAREAMLLLPESWCKLVCLSFSIALGPSSTIFEALALREVLKVLMHDCRWTKEIHSVVILLLPTPAWKNCTTRKGAEEKEGRIEGPLSWKESFYSNSITFFLPSTTLSEPWIQKGKGWMGVVVATLVLIAILPFYCFNIPMGTIRILPKRVVIMD